MKQIFRYTCIFIAGIVLVNSCKKENGLQTPNANEPPIANAGADQIISLPIDSAILNATQSFDPDGTIVSYQWIKIYATSFFFIANAQAAQTAVTHLTQGVYLFQLEVTDNEGLSAKDTVQFIVNMSGAVNQPPIAHAGPDMTINLPVNSITLDGSSCIDMDGVITSYQWQKISGPSSFTFGNSRAAITQVSNLTQGTYDFELRITDNGGLTAKDTVSVIVNPTLHYFTHLTSFPPDFWETGYWNNGQSFLMEINGKLYAGSSLKRELWLFDPQTNSWIAKGYFPGTMTVDPVIVFSVNGKGYCMWGSQSWQYDPATEQWVQKKNAPSFSFGVVPLVINNKVYFLQGIKVSMYDPSSDSYIPKNKFPGVGIESGFIINNEGYCIGSGECWKYDDANDAWQKKADLPQSLFSLSGFSFKNSGYVITDFNRSAYNLGSPVQVWRYSASLNSWQRINEDYPGYAAYDIKTVSLNGITYIGLGLSNADFPVNDFWSFKE